MLIRENLQPDPMKDYILEDLSGHLLLGRWLASNTYEGWFIKDAGSPYDDKEFPYIIPQSSLKIVFFYDAENERKKHRYIPKSYLDEAFRGRHEIAYYYVSGGNRGR